MTTRASESGGRARRPRHSASKRSPGHGQSCVHEHASYRHPFLPRPQGRGSAEIPDEMADLTNHQNRHDAALRRFADTLLERHLARRRHPRTWMPPLNELHYFDQSPEHGGRTGEMTSLWWRSTGGEGAAEGNASRSPGTRTSRRHRSTVSSTPCRSSTLTCSSRGTPPPPSPTVNAPVPRPIPRSVLDALARAERPRIAEMARVLGRHACRWLEQCDDILS